MKLGYFGAVLVAGAIGLAGSAAPALAASPMTDAFLANVAPNLDFLDRSSRFALTNSQSAPVKTYAFGEARDATLAANAVDDWVEANKAPAVAAAVADVNGVTTGRSVAIDTPAPAPRPATGPKIVDNRLPMGQEDLDSMEGLNGPEFDTMYKQKQHDALLQVQTDYAHYLDKGDDPAILAMAKSELPKIKHRIEALSKL